MVSVLAISWRLCRHCSCRWVMASPRSSSEPQGYFEVTCISGMCGWSNMRSLWPQGPLYPPGNWAFCPEVDVRERNVRCCVRSFGHSVSRWRWPNGAFTVLPLSEPSPWRSWSCGEKPSGQYLGLICDESLTCRGLNLNPRHFGSFTFIPCFS
jgi:hypothetical protein